MITLYNNVLPDLPISQSLSLFDLITSSPSVPIKKHPKQKNPNSQTQKEKQPNKEEKKGEVSNQFQDIFLSNLWYTGFSLSTSLLNQDF